MQSAGLGFVPIRMDTVPSDLKTEKHCREGPMRARGSRWYWGLRGWGFGEKAGTSVPGPPRGKQDWEAQAVATPP